MAEQEGRSAAPELRATLNLGLDIRIPPEYIASENLRLRTYKRIAGITNDAEREAIQRELADRFGPLPPAVSRSAGLRGAQVALRATADLLRGAPRYRSRSWTPTRPRRFSRRTWWAWFESTKAPRLTPSGVLTVSLGTAPKAPPKRFETYAPSRYRELECP